MNKVYKEARAITRTIGKATFIRGARTIDELREMTKKAGDVTKANYEVVGAAVLAPETYAAFCRDMAGRQRFLQEMPMRTGIDENGAWKCLYVTRPGHENKGILVNTEGYDYARYAALVE